MTRAIVLLAAAGLALAGLALPAASANTIPCDLDGDGWTNPAEAVACFAVGLVLHVTFETVQCALEGDSDVCLLP